MTPKEKRDRLFKGGRPHIRELRVYDGNKYHKDMGILWVAHKRSPFYQFDKDLTQEQFAKEISELASRGELLIAEDANKQYQGSGPIALVGVKNNGWKVEPHVQFFDWATPRNILRSTVAFLQMIRYRKIGACVVYALDESLNLFDRCCAYGVLHKVGKIENGDPRGDETVYSIRGKKCRKE
jgi:hypothetical protein